MTHEEAINFEHEVKKRLGRDFEPGEIGRMRYLSEKQGYGVGAVVQILRTDKNFSRAVDKLSEQA